MTSITVYISSHNLSGWFACVLFFCFCFCFFSIHITTAASQQHCREFLCRHHTWDFTSSIWFHRSHLAVWCHVSVEREVLRRKTDVLWSLTRMGPYFMSREGGVSTWFMVWCSVVCVAVPHIPVVTDRSREPPMCPRLGVNLSVSPLMVSGSDESDAAAAWVLKDTRRDVTEEGCNVLKWIC